MSKNVPPGFELLGAVPEVLGAPSRFGPSKVLEALRACRTGEIISLNLELDDEHGAPFGRSPLRRSMRLHNQLRPFGEGRYMVVNDDEVSFALQGSSQWDAYGHFGVIDSESDSIFFGGNLTDTFPAPSAGRIGIQALGPGIVTRGVLVDVVTEYGDGAPFLDGDCRIDTAMVERCLERQGVSVEPGDAVLVYTGMERRRASMGGAWPPDSAGLTADTISLWERLDIQALVSDNLGIDVTPGDNALHASLLKGRGVPLGELWALDHLAQRCRAESRWDFLLAAVPLNIFGAFGSPANAIAIW